MKSTTVLLGVALCVAMAVAYLDRRATRREVADLRSELERVSQTASESALATPRLVAVPVAVPVARDVTPTSSPSNAAPQPPSAARLEPARPQRQPTRIESFAPIRRGLETVFQAERVDPAWAAGARSLAENGLAAHLPEGSRLTAIECKATVCRIESVHGGYQQASKFVRDAVSQPENRPWPGGLAAGTIAEDAATGQVTMLIFLLREGVDLPPMEEDPQTVAGN